MNQTKSLTKSMFIKSLEKLGSPYVLEISNTFFIQLIKKPGDSKEELLNKISSLFHENIGHNAILWTIKICDSATATFTERARLLTIPDKFMERMLTTTLATSDAYIKMRAVDASYIDFAGHYALPNAVTTIDFMQDNQPGFSRYSITENAQYSAIEIYGQRHTVCTEVKNNGSHFSVDIRPMPMADIALG